VRKRLGIPLAFLAKRFGTSVDFLRKVEKGAAPVPDDILRFLGSLDLAAGWQFSRIATRIAKDEGKGRTVAVPKYGKVPSTAGECGMGLGDLPAEFHEACSKRLKDIFRRKGFRVVTVTFDATSFTAWTRETFGRSDGLWSRVLWAAAIRARLKETYKVKDAGTEGSEG
jgi:hypothetical protein